MLDVQGDLPATVAATSHDEVLYISEDRHSVVWQDLTRNLIYKRLHYPTPVLQATWAYFNYNKPIGTTTGASSTSNDIPTPPSGSSGNILSLCVLRDAELVVVYAPDGKTYDVALPCHAAHIWPLQEGLLIQRPPNTEASASNLGPSSPRWADLHHRTAVAVEGDGQTPSLFSLMHPLDELKPVAMGRDRDVRMSGECLKDFFCA